MKRHVAIIATALVATSCTSVNHHYGEVMNSSAEAGSFSGEMGDVEFNLDRQVFYVDRSSSLNRVVYIVLLPIRSLVASF